MTKLNLFSFYCSQSPFNVLCTPNKTRVPCILLCKKVKLILWLFYEYFLRSRRNFQPILTKNSFKPWTGVDHNVGQFFRGMEWLMFFLGHHCRQWFFNGFDKVGPSPLNVFWGVQPLEPMVFRWFSKFWGQWSTMVLRLTMESLVKIISPNDDNIISRYFKELWKIR